MWQRSYQRTRNGNIEKRVGLCWEMTGEGGWCGGGREGTELGEEKMFCSKVPETPSFMPKSMQYLSVFLPESTS